MSSENSFTRRNTTALGSGPESFESAIYTFSHPHPFKDALRLSNTLRAAFQAALPGLTPLIDHEEEGVVRVSLRNSELPELRDRFFVVLTQVERDFLSSAV